MFPIIILVGYSLRFIVLNTPKEARLFIFTLIGVTGLTLMLPDLILGGRRSIASRYLIPSSIGIQLACAFLITTKLTSRHILHQKLWSIIAMTILSAGIMSCATSFQSETWWNKFQSNDNSPIAKLVNQENSPLVVSDEVGILLSAKYSLNPSIHALFIGKIIINVLPLNYKKILLLSADKNTIKTINKNNKPCLFYPNRIILWSIVNHA